MVAPDILLARYELDPASAIERSGSARNSSAPVPISDRPADGLSWRARIGTICVGA